jgi:Lipocalin-like domain
LRCWKNVASDGSAVDPPGERPVGYIFYNHDGFRSVEIMAAHRAVSGAGRVRGHPGGAIGGDQHLLLLLRTVREAARP